MGEHYWINWKEVLYMRNKPQEQIEKYYKTIKIEICKSARRGDEKMGDYYRKRKKFIGEVFHLSEQTWKA